MLRFQNLWLVLIGLASLVVVTTAGAAPPTACAVDFEGLPAGTVVTELTGCQHRAVGRMRIVNVSIPAFEPEDEWFD